MKWTRKTAQAVRHQAEAACGKPLVLVLVLPDLVSFRAADGTGVLVWDDGPVVIAGIGEVGKFRERTRYPSLRYPLRDLSQSQVVQRETPDPGGFP